MLNNRKGLYSNYEKEKFFKKNIYLLKATHKSISIFRIQTRMTTFINSKTQEIRWSDEYCQI